NQRSNQYCDQSRACHFLTNRRGNALSARQIRANGSQFSQCSKYLFGGGGILDRGANRPPVFGWVTKLLDNNIIVAGLGKDISNSRFCCASFGKCQLVDAAAYEINAQAKRRTRSQERIDHNENTGNNHGG